MSVLVSSVASTHLLTLAGAVSPLGGNDDENGYHFDPVVALEGDLL